MCAPKSFAKFGYQTQTFSHQKGEKSVAKLKSDRLKLIQNFIIDMKVYMIVPCGDKILKKIYLCLLWGAVCNIHTLVDKSNYVETEVTFVDKSHCAWHVPVQCCFISFALKSHQFGQKTIWIWVLVTRFTECSSSFLGPSPSTSSVVISCFWYYRIALCVKLR